jgi:PKD repeat protein
MRKISSSESGTFNPRIFAAFILSFIAISLGMLSFGADPGSGTITPTASVPLTWQGTGSGGAAAGESSCVEGATCDTYTLTVGGTVADWAGKQARIVVGWDDPTHLGDYDVYVHKDSLAAPVARKSAGSDNPEVVDLNPSDADIGTGTFIVHVVYFTATNTMQYSGNISVIGGPPPEILPLASPPPQQPGVPRYYNYSPEPGIGETAGEPSIGYNLTSHHAMYISGLQTLRVTFPETGACEAMWDDVSYIYTKTRSLDPILFTDQRTGRTFVSQLDSVSQTASTGVLIGLNSFMAYSDNDGATWTPAQVNPPNGSYDHQSVGAGPYPASVPLGNAVNKGDAVYYCSQAGVTAFCARSDDGGLNFGPGTTIYTSTVDGCGGIHGHVKVAPDGTVYVPNRGCAGVQSLSVSEDAGTTWTVRHVQGTDAAGNAWSAKPPPGILDPSVGIASDGTLYFSWISSESDGGHAHVAVSHDKGLSWSNDYDLGVSYGLHNAVFVETVAGDPERAAVGFIGTTAPGSHESLNFKGTWYGFIATTYDGGQTWTTVNATPNAPVQREAGICNSGTGCTGNNRNLLDFNEITTDETGGVLYAYADGCINECESGGPNSYSAKATIARQSGGKGLLAAFDPTEPVVSEAACLSGRRDDMASYLQWRVPDNGGADITSYQIYRATTQPGSEVLIGQALGTKTSFNDRSVDPSVAKYIYRIVAVNSQGNGAPSNAVELTVGPRLEATGACGVPGVQVITDPTGDASDNLPQHDITSLSMAEPDSLPDTLVFTMKVADLTTIPPGWRWSVRFAVQGITPPTDFSGGASEDFFVSMVSSDGAAPTFTWGVTSVPQNAARVFTTKGDLDPVSTATADGSITLVLPKSALSSTALAPGTAVSLTLASVRATVPSTLPGTGGTNETIPDVTGAGSYALRSADLCLPNTAPLAVLAATPDSGVKPLTVNFDGSASYDSDSIDTIASYTFNFSDGGDDVTQTTPTISHTFTNAGLYPVKLVVTDSRGKVSSNTDQRLIEVAASSPTPTPTPTPTPKPKGKPKPTPSPTASPTPSATASPTATPKPKPTHPPHG